MRLIQQYSKFFVIISYLGMITINALANLLPINNISTGQVSDSYPNLFAPAGITFSIWGVIYSFLAAYTIYQYVIISRNKKTTIFKTISTLNPYFITSSIANMFWIFSWHYQQIGLSVLLMLIILFCLKKITGLINKNSYDKQNYILISIPFNIYLGWITVATIANITTYLVSLGWNGWGVSEQIWTIIILFIGAAIGIYRLLSNHNFEYGLVLIWAYLGIWIKHTSVATFAGQYPLIITTLLICLGFFTLAEAKVISSKILS